MQSTGPTLCLPYAEPFNWQALLAFLGPRAFPGIEDVTRDRYRRVMLQDGAPVIIAATRTIDDASLAVSVTPATPAAVPLFGERVRRLFDLDADPVAIGRHLAKDTVLKRAAIHRRGTRIPGAWSPFELAVRAIIGQQVSVKAATTFASRLVTRFGTPVVTAADPLLIRTFPAPAILARTDLTAIGLIRSRAKWISALAAVLEAEPTFFDLLHPLDHAIKELTRLPGIGQWTAHYIAMRALKEADAFPTGDLALLRAYSQLAGSSVTARELDRIAERWRPWRAYAAIHLWLSDPASGG
ncbi:MAG: DNA-3-methyladenine glycosylase 2 family protein [Betaproteobacteria bacterium]|nr:DNA-3-methyladenine glycosylase 2 family protein [Betaproteobacteria bacterium]